MRVLVVFGALLLYSTLVLGKPKTVQDEGPLCVCTLEFAPVCASNHKTYNNICLFKCERDYLRSKGGPEIVLLHRGECKDLRSD
ncbi:turripeptide OL11-like [Orussus abietinus]|uniref:turripeptide OL11-like n=1 Tax=Orussus abietinus TaxID=222816 RepID=UPI0006260DD1|nr:turripeptide OL11-like [Orussus abietinus]